MKCSECRFRDKETYECRRNPPTLLVGSAYGYWPCVGNNHYCHKFEPIPARTPVPRGTRVKKKAKSTND